MFCVSITDTLYTSNIVFACLAANGYATHTDCKKVSPFVSYKVHEVFNLIRGGRDGQKLAVRYKPSERRAVFKVGGRGINEWHNYFLTSPSFRISPVYPIRRVTF
jgi:hypothetical protein